MNPRKFVFVGDKFPVLNCMIKHSLNVVAAFRARNFCHGKPLADQALNVETIENKNALLRSLDSISFDVLVSNGCPYILPISRLKKPGQIFINLHGSMLPKFPGPHPVNAAMRAGHDGGATCHHMVDEMDAGAIVSQVRIENSPDLDLGLLFVLTSMAEVDAFELALERDFVPDDSYSNAVQRETYFKVTNENRAIDFTCDAESLVQHIRAFGMHTQGATFCHLGHEFQVFDSAIVTNSFLCSKSEIFQENEVAFVYDSTVVIKKNNVFVQLKDVFTNSGSLHVGEILTNP